MTLAMKTLAVCHATLLMLVISACSGRRGQAVYANSLTHAALDDRTFELVAQVPPDDDLSINNALHLLRRGGIKHRAVGGLTFSLSVRATDARRAMDVLAGDQDLRAHASIAGREPIRQPTSVAIAGPFPTSGMELAERAREKLLRDALRDIRVVRHLAGREVVGGTIEERYAILEASTARAIDVTLNLSAEPVPERLQFQAWREDGLAITLRSIPYRSDRLDDSDAR